MGCIRAFTVNGHLMDLVVYAEAGAAPESRESGDGAVASQGNAGDLVQTAKLAFGVRRGCVGKCDSSPCFNGGECEERYDSFWCDCTFTAFRCVCVCLFVCVCVGVCMCVRDGQTSKEREAEKA